MTDEQRRAFILANTMPLSPPLVPEITLRLAEESLPIWRKSEEELEQANVPPPYWAFAWAGGQALARYLFDTPASVRGKRVLDVGSGSGLTAIAAAMLGATQVLASDIDALALAAIAVNADANGVRVEITGTDLLAAGSAIGDWDVVLIGDLFYERSLADAVVAFAGQAAGRGALVLAGDPQRSYFPRDLFEMLAEHSVPVTRELEDSTIKRTAVWRLSALERPGP
jgi:predicted nicotinamide N-methyase